MAEFQFPPDRRTLKPDTYKPEYCEMLIAHMEQGFSFTSFGGVINKCKQTLFNWVKDHPEFSEAKDIAFAKCEMWWEKQGIDGLYSHKDGPNLNGGVWIFNMKGRFGWRDQMDLSANVKNTDQNTESLSELVTMLKEAKSIK